MNKHIIEPEKVKIISSPQYLGLIIGFVFTIGVTYGTFNHVRIQVNRLQDKVENLDKDLLNKIEQQNKEFNNGLLELNRSYAKIEGKLEILLEKPNK